MICSIVNCQSGSQISSITSPPNFCYVLAVHESSHVSLCQDVHVGCEGTKTSAWFAFTMGCIPKYSNRFVLE